MIIFTTVTLSITPTASDGLIMYLGKVRDETLHSTIVAFKFIYKLLCFNVGNA